MVALGLWNREGFAVWCAVRGWIATMQRDPELARRINLLFDIMHTRTEPPLSTETAAAAMSARGGPAISAARLEQFRLGYRGDALDAQLSVVAEFFGVPSIYLTETGFGPASTPSFILCGSCARWGSRARAWPVSDGRRR